MKGAGSGVCRDVVGGLGIVGSGDMIRSSDSIGLEKTAGDVEGEGARDEGNRGMGMGTLQCGGSLAISSGDGEAR